VLRRSTVAVAFAAIALTFAFGETFTASLVKVEGNKVTYKKATLNTEPRKASTGRWKYADPVTVEASKGVAITQGHFLPDGRMHEETERIKEGLDYEVFKKLPEREKLMRPSLITIADEGSDKGKITAFRLWKSAPPR
jgi:hypothetical protein